MSDLIKIKVNIVEYLEKIILIVVIYVFYSPLLLRKRICCLANKYLTMFIRHQSLIKAKYICDVKQTIFYRSNRWCTFHQITRSKNIWTVTQLSTNILDFKYSNQDVTEVHTVSLKVFNESIALPV